MTTEANSRNYRDLLRKFQHARDLKQFEFASVVGRSPAWYSQILNGRRRLRVSLAVEVADRLGLSEEDRQELLTLVEAEESPHSSVRPPHISTPAPTKKRPSRAARFAPHRTVKAEADDIAGQWHLGAILQLARCEDYVPDPHMVGATLRPRISPEDAQAGMDHLRDRGLLDAQYRIVDARDGVVTEGHPLAPTCGTSQAAENLMRTLKMAQNALQRGRHTDRTYVGGTLALSENDALRLHEALRDLVRTLLASASREAPNRVYEFNLALFPVSLYSDSLVDPQAVPGDVP